MKIISAILISVFLYSAGIAYEQEGDQPKNRIRTGDAAGEGLLFDLVNDPAEQKNVAAQRPGIVEKQKRRAAEYRFTAPHSN